MCVKDNIEYAEVNHKMKVSWACALSRYFNVHRRRNTIRQI